MSDVSVILFLFVANNNFDESGFENKNCGASSTFRVMRKSLP